MEWWVTLSLILGGVLVLLFIGVPVAFSFLFVNIIAVYYFWGGIPGLNQLILSVYESVSSFTLFPIFLFVLMGEIMFRSRVAPQMMDVLDKWMGRVPGRLSLLAVAGGTLFATLSGASIAGVAMLGSVLVPEMQRRGYKKPMVLGPIIGSGGLAMMIPPSSLGVLLAALAQFSVGTFLIAILIPGLIMAVCYGGYIVIRCILQPHLAPVYQVERTPVGVKLSLTAKYIMPLSLVIFMVIGLMFLGIATPTESAAMGALSCIILAGFYRKLSLRMLRESAENTMKISVMMYMIFTGSAAFSQILSFTGASTGLVETVASLNLPPILLMICMQLILLIMGTFMSTVAIMMVTIPIFMPIVSILGFEPIWFGAIMLLNMEMATSTPPFGMLLFVMKGVVTDKSISMGDIYKAGLPFIFCDMVTMGLMMTFPQLVLWLPSKMM
jgi:tripartite ATP-independent transporter DctM subunit